jgi:PPOX class probable F420-dependent enzyme
MSSRLATAKNIWVATVRPDGRPHLAPVWFVVNDGHWYFVTDPKSMKARNLQRNSKIALSLEDGDDPLVIEGEARPVEPSAEVIRLFKEKYNWDITTDSQYSQTFEVKAKKQVMGSLP